MLQKLKMTLKSMTSLDFIMKIRFLSGIYHEWIPNKRLKLFAKILFFFIGTASSGIVFFNTMNSIMFDMNKFAIYILLLEYYFHIIMPILTGEKYFFRYMSTLKTIDGIMKFKNTNDTVIAYIILALATTTTCAVSVVMYLTLPVFMYTSNITLAIAFINTIASVPKVIIFESLCKRVKLLREWVLQHADNTDKSMTWKKCVHTYKNLLDNVKQNILVVKCIMLIELPILLLNILTAPYRIVNGILNEQARQSEAEALSVFCYTLCFVVCGLGPAICLERTAYDQEKLKAMLAYDILMETDRKSRLVMKDMLVQLDGRPPKFTLLRVIPLDIRLVTGIASICVTYTIVLLQFKQ